MNMYYMLCLGKFSRHMFNTALVVGLFGMLGALVGGFAPGLTGLLIGATIGGVATAARGSVLVKKEGMPSAYIIGHAISGVLGGGIGSRFGFWDCFAGFLITGIACYLISKHIVAPRFDPDFPRPDMKPPEPDSQH